MAMLIQALAAALLLLGLFWLFRFAMGLRYAKLLREEDRRDQEAKGRRVVAEVPTQAGDLVLFLEHAEAFQWGGRELRKSDVEGVRLLVNGRVVDARQRLGVALPPPGFPEREGRERWDVLVSLAGGGAVEIPCGSLGEGVSREAAQRVFAAVAAAVSGDSRSPSPDVGRG